MEMLFASAKLLHLGGAVIQSNVMLEDDNNPNINSFTARDGQNTGEQGMLCLHPVP